MGAESRRFKSCYPDHYSGIAQSVERLPVKQVVTGSNPVAGAILNSQKEHFEQNILPTLSEYMKGRWNSPYDNMRVYHLTQEQKSAIIFPHEEGCEIELLKQLRKKLIKIQE